MSLVYAGLVLGALVGAFQAKRNDGQTKDVLQWAAVYGIIFGIIGLFLTIFILRSAT